MPDEAWKIKDIIGEQFEFDLIFNICDALKLDDDGDIFWSVKATMLTNESVSKTIQNI